MSISTCLYVMYIYMYMCINICINSPISLYMYSAVGSLYLTRSSVRTSDVRRPTQRKLSPFVSTKRADGEHPQELWKGLTKPKKRSPNTGARANNTLHT